MTFLRPGKSRAGEAGTARRPCRANSEGLSAGSVSGESVVGALPESTVSSQALLGFEVSPEDLAAVSSTCRAIQSHLRRHGGRSSRTTSGALASTDFFGVPTAQSVQSILSVLVVLRTRASADCSHRHHGTPDCGVGRATDPGLPAFDPWETAPRRYPIRDRDRVYGIAFRSRIKAMGIEEVVTAPRSPWQSPYVERVIGSNSAESVWIT